MKKYSGLFGAVCLLGSILAYVQYREKFLSWDTSRLYSQLIGEEAYYLATRSKPSPALAILLLLAGIILIVVAFSAQNEKKKLEITPSLEMQVCPKCGVARTANAAFCHNCGYDFSLESKEVKNEED